MKTNKLIRTREILAISKILMTGGLGFLSGSARANLITNGSFEAPDVGAPFAFTTPTGWTSAGNTLIFDTGGSGYPLPEDGNQYAGLGFVGPGNSISQTFSIASAGNYILDWYDNGTINDQYGYAISIVDLANPLLPVVSAGYTGTGSATGWQQETLSLSLNSGNYSLKFSAKTGLGTALDNASLEESVTPPAVPDGSNTLSLFALSAAALGVVHFGLKPKFSE